MNTELKAKTLNYIKTHPLMSFAQFSKQSGIKISDCYYYMIRGEVFTRGKRVNAPYKSGRIYINLLTIPSRNLSEETKKTVLEVVKAISTIGIHLEIIKNIGEKTLEIRRSGLK